ncbi:DUF3987 domain-containing protein [Psychrobacter arenosus]
MMTDDRDNKAHAQGTGLVEYLADFRDLTQADIADNDTIAKLLEIRDDHSKPSNITNSVLYCHTDISIFTGQLKGVKEQGTAGTIGLVMLNKQGSIANLASQSINDGGRLFISDTGQPSAFVIGPMNRKGKWWAVNTLDEGVSLYAKLSEHDENVTVLVILAPSLFNKAVMHFAEVQTVYITATSNDKDRLTKPLAGVNVKAVITEFMTLLEHLEMNHSLNDVIADAEVIDLQAQAWPQPEDLSTDPNRPTPYPMNAWIGLLRKVIEKIAYYAQVPPAMAGQCVLGALSHMGQRFVDAPMGHKHMPASLILITEGESGSGKTVAMGLSHKEIKEYEQQQYNAYLLLLDEWEKTKASLKGAELQEFLATEPKPFNPETMFKAPTIEPILDKFVNGEIVNASWTTDDAAQFFNGHTMTGNTAGSALADITDLYSEGVVNRTRSQKNAFATPRTKAYDVRFTLNLMAQRIILEPALTDDMMNQQGFLARALIACPESLQGQRVWNDIERRQQSPYNDHDLIAYWSRCQSLLDPAPVNDPQADPNKPERIKMRWHDAQAEQVFYDAMQEIENRQAKGKTLEYLKAYASRMAENASRIASLMAFFEERKTITADDIRRAFMLVEYSTAERLRYLDANPTGQENNTQKLSKWLIEKAKDKRPHKLNRTYVSNSAPNPMRKNSKILQSELDKLESAGHIKQSMEGRRSVIEVNPNIYA